MAICFCMLFLCSSFGELLVKAKVPQGWSIHLIFKESVYFLSPLLLTLLPVADGYLCTNAKLLCAYCIYEKPQHAMEAGSRKKEKEHLYSQISLPAVLDKTPGANFKCPKPKAHENNKFLHFSEFL